ncbi:MAG: butyrate kinase, partial [Clostridiales bacterium]|nr:butyrate kinase [Clostridiales bacterium]
MHKQTQTVELLVENIPGVLGRVVGHIRNEGWNIKRLHVDETEREHISKMEIEIEGANTKLALVAERMLGLDCVLSIAMDGQTKQKPAPPPPPDEPASAEASSVPRKPDGVFRILTINPGSTSTKFALYDGEAPILKQTIRHDRAILDAFGTILSQKGYRKQCVIGALTAAGAELRDIDAIAGRGGLLKPIESGTYFVNAAMLADLHTATAALHASALGAIIAGEIGAECGKPAYVVDPVVVDEMDRHAKLTGMPGIERSSVFHALNQKAIARRLAGNLGKPYENCRFVVAHLGGGITVGAHRYGRVIDVNDALSGEGAFTPERSGSIPAAPLIRMCYSGEYTEEEMLDKVVRNSGMTAYLGTNDMRKVQKMMASGDDFATLVLDSMAYQVAKDIGAMCAV